MRAHGARLVGPNCLGIAVPGRGLNATFAPRALPAGRIGFSSQSGALGLALLEKAAERSLGFSAFVSIGNKADVSSNDLLEWWEDDEETDLVLLYLESFGNPRTFSRVARRVARRKPILALKAGLDLGRARAPPARTPPRSPARTRRSTRSSTRPACCARRRSRSSSTPRRSSRASRCRRAPRRRDHERRRPRDPLRRRLRGGRARAARADRGDARGARAARARRGEPREPDRPARLGDRDHLRGGDRPRPRRPEHRRADRRSSCRRSSPAPTRSRRRSAARSSASGTRSR